MLLHLDVCVTANVPEDGVHALETLPGADPGVVVVGHGVKERDTLTLLKDLVVGCGEQAVGQAVPEITRKKVKYYTTLNVLALSSQYCTVADWTRNGLDTGKCLLP